MNTKMISVGVLVIVGLYFVFFHTSPFPFNHEAIGLPPFHTAHTIFGFVLLAVAGFVGMKK